jgi:hypothetical protein
MNSDKYSPSKVARVPNSRLRAPQNWAKGLDAPRCGSPPSETRTKSLRSYAITALPLPPFSRRAPSSQAPLLGPGPLRTGRETFVLIRLKPFERLFQGDAVFDTERCWR